MPGSWSEAGMRARKKVRTPMGWIASASLVTASSRISYFVARGPAARTLRAKAGTSGKGTDGASGVNTKPPKRWRILAST